MDNALLHWTGDETCSDFLWQSVTSIHSNSLYITAPEATGGCVPLTEMTELYRVEQSKDAHTRIQVEPKKR
jgi:hypothetical protein